MLQEVAIDYGFWKLVMDGVQLAGLIGVWIYAVMTRQARQNTDRLDEIETDIDQIKLHVNLAPTKTDVEKVHTRISDVKDSVAGVNRDLGKIEGTLVNMNETLKLIQRTMMKGTGDD